MSSISTILDFEVFMEYPMNFVLAGGPGTAGTTTAAVVSQSPQLYNQQTTSADTPVNYVVFYCKNIGLV